METQRENHCVVSGRLLTPLALAGRVHARPAPAWAEMQETFKRRKWSFLTGVLAVGEIQAFGRKLKTFRHQLAQNNFSFFKFSFWNITWIWKRHNTFYFLDHAEKKTI